MLDFPPNHVVHEMYGETWDSLLTGLQYKTDVDIWTGNGNYRIGSFDGKAFTPETESMSSYYGDTYTDVIKGYIASQLELDIMVEIIMDDLEEKGLLDDTVIIFTRRFLV